VIQRRGEGKVPLPDPRANAGSFGTSLRIFGLTRNIVARRAPQNSLARPHRKDAGKIWFLFRSAELLRVGPQ